LKNNFVKPITAQNTVLPQTILQNSSTEMDREHFHKVF